MTTNAVERARWNDDDWARMWPKREALTDSVTPPLLDALALSSGEHVLDIGCGGGKATIAAGGRAGPDGAAVGADISEPLLRLATERAANTGNVTFTCADVQVDTVAGGPFDAAMSQFGVMFFDDPAVAFANIAAHLRPEGRIAFACWQSLDRNPWFPGAALAPFVAPPPAAAPGASPTGPFTLCDPDRIQQLLAGSGFADVTIDRREHDVHVPEDAVADDAQLVFLGVGEDDMGPARAALDSHMAQFDADGELRRLPLAYFVVTATRTA